MEKTIPIIFTVDDNYIPFFAVALQSLIDNASKEYNYEIKVLYTKPTEKNKSTISEDNQTRIKNRYEAENISIEFVDVNPYL